MSEYIFPLTGTTVQFVDPWTLPYDIICNGFSLKDTIKEVMLSYDFFDYNLDIVEGIAEDIKEALAVKLRLKQG